VQAKPRGAWVQEKRQFRWELSDMSPGASLVVRVAFPPAPKQADVAQRAKVCLHLLKLFLANHTCSSSFPFYREPHLQWFLPHL
jgi:hypothetical protein